ncbi:mechanosensitive ion channel family protein [Patescibacteria group bacterium]|nr:mechanosensitive ion channel family protein [Patescibacteria group bacterium]
MDIIQEFAVNFIQQRGMDLFWIIILFFFGRVVLKLIVKRLVRIVDDKRAMTLGRIIVATGNVAIYVIILLMVLSLFGLDITPILAGAGVIGLAIGFGAQSLVKDFVSGLFILIENQYDMGDRVKIGTFEGRVVKITMRSTVLRDDEGKTFYISNGLINNVINLSQDNN